MTTTHRVATASPVSQASVSQGRWLLVFILGYLALMADGADVMMYGLTLTRIKDDFGLSNVQAGALGSLTLLGMAVGGILGGWASDRIGRVRVVVWALALFSLGAGLLGLTHSFLEFAIVRFISSLGIGSMVLVTTLVAEYVPTERRSLILGALQTGISAGYIVVIALSSWILPHYGWRTLYYVSALPVVFALAIKFAVPEPASWQASHAVERTSQRRWRGSRYHVIFSNRQTRTLFILWTLTSVFILSGFYGLNNWLPTYLEKELHIKFSALTGYMIGTYVVAFVGKIFAGWLGDRWSRRGVYIFGCVGAALFSAGDRLLAYAREHCRSHAFLRFSIRRTAGHDRHFHVREFRHFDPRHCCGRLLQPGPFLLGRGAYRDRLPGHTVLHRSGLPCGRRGVLPERRDRGVHPGPLVRHGPPVHAVSRSRCAQRAFYFS
ncbi:AAHS family cis,cis-muconate transporter-like MFS transporter [Paraburkholderia sp. BL9I2N2]|nr:AAHS family cis,cis-muconate transporter-like MFS transporter [Paraburkholderia sp. BL9I2N2]